ncbi:MAG: SMR family transporter [Campylobacter sp.]
MQSPYTPLVRLFYSGFYSTCLRYFRHIPMGIAYAIRSGAGIVLISAIAYFFMGQKLDLPAIIAIGMIVAGVAVINLF